MTKNGNGDNLEECNYGTLIEKYGPNYEPLKDKLGYIKGLFE